jgi:TRAP transporter 4TM/12TM fusion protein
VAGPSDGGGGAGSQGLPAAAPVPRAGEVRPEEVEAGLRRPGGWQAQLILALAIGFSLFHLYTSAFGLLPATLQRSVHLTFAIVLAYVLYPFRRRPTTARIPWFDFLLAAAAGTGAFYVYWEYARLIHRVGAPAPIDLVFGALLTVLLLEAARRTVGPALPLIAGLFIGYTIVGPYLPGILAHRGYTFRRVLDQLYMTNEGIFGIPLGVSSTFVFLFVLFGALLQQAGAGEYFIQLAYSLLGHFRGGPAKAAIVASALLGLVSGSSIANTVTTGTFTIPLIRRVGYPAEKAGAIEVAASTNSQLMPPIMGAAAFIIAEFLGISYFEVIAAAAIPAFLSYIALFYIIHLEALKLGIQGVPRAELPRPLDVFVRGLHYLIPLGVLIYSLVILRLTPITAAFNSIVLVVAIMLVQGPVRWLWRATRGKPRATLADEAWDGVRRLIKGLELGARNMVAIGVATATAGIVVGTITLTGLGLRLAEIIDVISGGYLIAMLFITAIASLILGMGLPTTANYVVMATLTAPALLLLAPDLSPLAVHLFVFFFGILADDTPPVGLAAYAVSPIAKSDPIRTGLQAFAYDIRTAILPFFFIFNPELLLIGVTSVWQGAHVALTALVGMFAFAAATQGWVLMRATLLERAILLATALTLIKAGFVTDLIGGSLYASVYLIQWLRLRAARARG